jgi:putative FmdB family regulatory protein
MPIFEWKCNNCGTVFDRFKFRNDDQNDVCPKCNRLVTVENRVMSVSNFNAIDLRCQRIFGHDLKGRWTSEAHKAEAKH